jgi:hypothetical protein
MQLTVYTNDTVIGQALLGADPSAKDQDPKQLEALNADFSASAAIAFTLKSLAAVPKLAKALSAAIGSVAVPKPKAKLVLKGPFGEMTLEIANITEDGLRAALESVFEIYERKTPVADKNRKAASLKSKGD